MKLNGAVQSVKTKIGFMTMIKKKLVNNHPMICISFKIFLSTLESSWKYTNSARFPFKC